jgi:hypothetical protein
MLLAYVVYAQSNIDSPNFGPRTSLGTIENDDIDEASGLASSYMNKGILWTHNDSGGENRIFAIDTNGISRGTFYLNGIENRDWEDITVGPGPDEDKSYLYIADIGDNSSQFEIKYIYRIEEPIVLSDQSNSNKIIQNISTIAFTYPDGKRDAETLMIDPVTKDLYILSKRDTKTRLYRLPFPQNTNSVFQAELANEIKFPLDPEDNTPQNYLTSGGISMDGNEIIVKSYSNIYYWYRTLDKTIAETMAITPETITYTTEPQGEAICWKNFNDNGYFTLSEENINFGGTTFIVPAVLYYYPRQIISTSIKSESVQNNFSLSQNFPNPFNPITSITFSVPNVLDANSLPTGRQIAATVKLIVYDLMGNEIAQLINERKTSGEYKVNFDGSKLSSGIYYYKLTIDKFVNTKKMVLLK